MTCVFIVMENPDAFGGTPKEPADLIHAVFFERRRAEDFVQGMASYVSRYESRSLSVVAGRAQDEDGTTYFEIVDIGVTGGDDA